MLLAASPGGISANLYSHLANGDVALNITLTAINSLLSMLTLPLIVNWSLLAFVGEGKAIPLQFSKVIQLFVIVLGPVAIGMWVNHRFNAFSESMRKPVKILAALCLVLVMLLALFRNWSSLSEHVGVVGAAALCFNLVSLATGFVVPRLLMLSKRQCIAISMEIGIHNGTLAIAIALSPQMLNNELMAIPAAVYGMWMFFTAAAFAWWVNRRYAAELKAAPSS
jgi:BASS family bile acid:Na+ symporter